MLSAHISSCLKCKKKNIVAQFNERILYFSLKTAVYVLTSVLFLHWKQQTAWQGNEIPKFLFINMANMFLYLNRLLKRKEI